MVSFNSVVLAGQLSQDPELHYSSDGTAICDLRLVVTRVWKGKDGQKHEDACYVDVVLKNRTAEIAAQYLTKGKSVLVHGSLEQRRWVDKKTKENRNKHEIRGNAIKFLGGGPDDLKRGRAPDGAQDEEE